MTDKKNLSQELPYSCLQCSYKSSKPRNLHKHLISKHDFKKATEVTINQSITSVKDENLIFSKEDKSNYNCDKCNYAGSKRLDLKLHIQSKHEGLLVNCDYCSYKAISKQRLKSHITEKHAGMMFSCDHCEVKA